MTYNDIIRCGELFKKAKIKFFEDWGCEELHDEIKNPLDRCKKRKIDLEEINQAFIEEGAIGDFLTLEERQELKNIWKKIVKCVKENNDK